MIGSRMEPAETGRPGGNARTPPAQTASPGRLELLMYLRQIQPWPTTQLLIKVTVFLAKI